MECMLSLQSFKAVIQAGLVLAFKDSFTKVLTKL